MVSKAAVSLQVKCIHGHKFVLSPDIKLKIKGGNASPGFQAVCPTCGGVAPLKTVAVGKMLGLGNSATMDQCMASLGMEADAPAVETLDELLGTPLGEDVPAGNEDDGDDDDDTGEDDGMNQDPESVGADPEPESYRAAAQVMPKKPSVVIPARDRLSPPPAMEAGEDLPTAQDVFLNVVKTSQLADDIKVFLTEWILVSDSKWEDPRVVREALLKANVPQAKADQLAKKFESTMELIQRRDDRNRGMASLVAGDLGGSMRFRSPEYLSSSSRAGSPSRSGDDDLETATINALLERNGHRVTVDVLRQIDELRAMFAMRRGEAAPVVPGSSPVFSAVSSMSPQSIQQMIQQSNQQTLDAVKQMLESRNQKEKDEAREIERKAADDKRYQDMMNLMTMAIASKNSVPIQPVESPEKMMLGQVMDILKEKMTAPPPPPPKDLTEHPLFVKLFDKITNDKPSEAMQGVYQQLDSLKDQIGHIGGGPAGLPSNPEQLHAYVDYMKTMHDIDKTKREFEDKAETRKVIATVATSALQSIGEAIAATYTQNPGTPQAREVTVEERRVDDGSVIQFACPSCKAVISAPATARAVKCPSCGSILDRAGQTMSEEQLAELQRQVLAEQAAAEEGEMPAAPEEPKVETPPLTVAKPSDPHELGPVSRQMHVAAPSPPPPAPAPVEESPVLAAVNETDLSQSEQPPAQETG